MSTETAPPWVEAVFASFDDEPHKNGKANGKSNITFSWRDHVYTAADLQRRKFPPVSYCVPELIPEGLTIIAGRPKVGKAGWRWMFASLLRPVAIAWANANRRKAAFYMPPWRTIRVGCSGASTNCYRPSMTNGRNA
jgi:hypothetical protein